jgi:hypothetical protein
MKKLIAILSIFAVAVIGLYATNYLFVFTSDKSVTAIDRSSIDSIKFTSNQTLLSIYKGNSIAASYDLSAIDSLTFGNVNANEVSIIYSASGVAVTNPFAGKGIDITITGGDVTVTSKLTDTQINYILSGTTSDGSLKLYSNYKYQLTLSGVNITNTDGPAINIQSGKKCTLVLADGTTNTLADGASYAGSTEDQKATLFSEGQIAFDGTGTLNVSSISKHAIASDDYISISNGVINITSAGKDGIHTGDYFKMSNGTLTITPTGDGIDSEGYVSISGGNIIFTSSVADIKAISSDSIMNISGGIFNLSVNGNQSKGLKGKQNMTLNGGTFTINTAGAAVLEASGSGYDPSYCTAIKGDSSVLIKGGTFTIKATGTGGKGISADKNIEISGGQITITTIGGGAIYTNETGTKDAYNATCLSADQNILIADGTVILSSSGQGGKGISADGTFTMGSSSTSPTLSVTTTGTEIASGSTSYASSKAITADGDVKFYSGTTTISSADDAIKSETNIYIEGGNITATKSYEALEAPYIYIDGGTTDITATNDGVNATKGTVSGGTEQNDGSCLYVRDGTLIASCTNGDAIDSNGNIVITGGLTIANGPSSNAEEAADFNGTFSMNSGIFIGAGSNSNMTKPMSSSSTQPNMYISSNSQISSSTFLNIKINSTDVITFKPKYGAYKFLISTPEMSKGASYSIYTGGSYSTITNIGGYYSGGTYTPGTLKKSGTLSTSSTVNSISF